MRRLIAAASSWLVMGAAWHCVSFWGRCIVSAGPFRGMRYVRRAQGSTYWPKVLGSYEVEAQCWIERHLSLDARHDVVVNVGAGEGYYAVGAALRRKDLSIVAFESSLRGRALIEKLARTNGCATRVVIRSHCFASSLETAVARYAHPFVIVDVEGSEATLLDPLVAPSLQHCAIFVEVHDFIDPTIADVLSYRFRETHEICEVRERPRSEADLPPLFFRTLRWRWARRAGVLLLSERRPQQMRWLLLEPLQRCERVPRRGEGLHAQAELPFATHRS